MLKLIIADDERIIRETISNLIDWESIGIELVGLCKDGIEAYNMILDESPDIVMTDIKMPGMSGLELISRITKTDLTTQFILLSGYGEFSYAKEAMKYGVRHYLLKPCSEEQIMTSMKEVMADCYHKRAFHQTQEQQKQLTLNLQNHIIATIVNEGIVSDSPGDELFHPYEHMMDFTGTGYELCYLYFLEAKNIRECLRLIYEYNQKNAPGIPVHAIYVQNTLLLFFQSYETDYQLFDTFAGNIRFAEQSVDITYQRHSYENLARLLKDVFVKIKRYGTIYCINGYHMIPTCNYQTLIQLVEQLSARISDTPAPSKELAELTSILNSVDSTDFLKQLTTAFLMKFSSQADTCSPLVVTEFLLELNQLEYIEDVRTAVLEKLPEIVSAISRSEEKQGEFRSRIEPYVLEHLSNPNLTLKWIAENYLYMNVDYVSKKFIKETGYKFSKFLTDLRVQKAKELLADSDAEKIQVIAEAVGCGNNPQYFSQIFKKSTGMTPSAYIKKINGGT